MCQNPTPPSRLNVTANKANPWEPPKPLPPDDAVYFKVCWVNPDHGGTEISGGWMTCPVCKVQWSRGPYWKIQDRWWSSRAAYEQWTFSQSKDVDPTRRDLTHT